MRKIILAGLMAATAIAPLSPALAQVQFAQRDHDRRGNNHADRQQTRGENRVERQERRVERSQARPNVRSESRNVRSVKRQDNPGAERNRRDTRQVNRQAQRSRDNHRDNRRSQPNWREGRQDNRTTSRNWRDSRQGDRRDWRNNRSNDRREWRDNRSNSRVVQNRWNNQRRWDRDWRNDRRYDWRGYRHSHRQIYRMPRYYAPRGWHNSYSRYSVGIYLNDLLFARNYWIDDPHYYRLPPAYGSMRWIRYYDDALLVDTRDGYVVDVIYDFFD